MPIGIVFWVVLLIAVIFGFLGFRQSPSDPRYVFGGNLILLILLILLFLLGWGVFGLIVRG